MYITLEGIDTAGKSTQIEALKAHYSDGIFTKEPGGSEIGAKIRELVLFGDIASKRAEMFLFLADRAEHIDKIILPNINHLIISDRSVVSGIAYAMDSENIDMLIELNKIATNNILPNIAFILTLDSDTLRYRLSQKESDSIESRGIEYLLNIQNNLIKASNRLGIKTVEIDASQNIDDITKTIIKTIEENR